MTLLANLVPDPTTDHFFVPRAASMNLTAFGSFMTPTGVTAGLVVGDLFYGMVSTSRNAGKDEPFIYNLANNTFITVSGITNANTPTTPATTGDWNPPIMEVVGSRIIITHPGFGGVATGYYFGWFDISGFSDSTLGDVASGSNIITGNPNIIGVTPGMTVAGTGITPGTTVTNTANVTFTPTGTTHSSTTIDSISDMTGIAVGQNISGSGIPAGTTISTVNVGGSSITISQAATSGASGVALTITGTTITLSANGTATNTGVSLTIAGGTPSAPLWAAGNTLINPLASVPVFVKQFNNRAYYGVGNQAVFSDPLNPLQITNANQALTIGDTTPVTAMGTTPFNSTAGGIIQSLIVFKQNIMGQVQGDLALNNLTLNMMPFGIGTSAARSVINTPQGLAFVANDGLRFVDLVGNLTPPIGDHGQGIAYPFVAALHPSRICSAYNSDTLRISVQNGGAPSSPFQDWWFDMTRKIWTGPHTFPSNLCQPWRNTFVTVPQSSPAGLWQSNDVPSAGDSYTENGTPLAWDYQTVLLPDSQQMALNSVVESSIGLGFYTNGQILTFIAFDENNNTLSQVQINFTSNPTIWGSFTWGAAPWLGNFLSYKQHVIPWDQPLVANQMTIQVNGFSSAGLKIGNLFLRYKPLGYMVQT